MVAPRRPSGFGDPTVVSLVVWCSISALISVPRSTTMPKLRIQVVRPINAPSKP